MYVKAILIHCAGGGDGRCLLVRLLCGLAFFQSSISSFSAYSLRVVGAIHLVDHPRHAPHRLSLECGDLLHGVHPLCRIHIELLEGAHGRGQRHHAPVVGEKFVL
jgi:hypothetical protein